MTFETVANMGICEVLPHRARLAAAYVRRGARRLVDCTTATNAAA